MFVFLGQRYFYGKKSAHVLGLRHNIFRQSTLSTF